MVYGKLLKKVSLVVVAMLFAFGVSNGLLAQNAPTGCPSIYPAGTVSGLDTTIQCGGCLWLHADVVATATTANDYTVSSILYNPPFSFSAGTQLTGFTDDHYIQVMNLPFNFCFYGSTYSQICVGSNGIISFNPANANGYCTYSFYGGLPIPNAGFSSDAKNAIYGVYEDIYPNYSGNNSGQIFTGVMGQYPCRTACVSYYRCPLFGNYSVTNTYQIVLYEGTNIIDVYIQNRSCCSSTNNGEGLVGVQDATGTRAVSPQGRNGGTWTTQYEAWRFTPTGTPHYVVTWYDGLDTNQATATILGHDTINSDTAVSRIYVCPTGVNHYTARLRYIACNGEHFDIINTTTITSNEPVYTDTTLCSNTPYTFYGRTYSRTGHYGDTIRNSAGCDSVIHRLYLKMGSTYTDNETACDSYTWIDGNTYTHSTNTPVFHTTNYLGCDSTVTLNLIVENVTIREIFDTICGNRTYRFAGRVLNQTGTYYDSCQTAHGCDSVTILHLVQKNAPTPQFKATPNPIELCKMTSVSITDQNPESQSNRNTWNWGDGQVLSQNGGTVSHTYTDLGNFTINCYIEAQNGCLDTVSFPVKVYDFTKADFTWDPQLISALSPIVNLHNISSVHYPQNTYDWKIWPDTSTSVPPIMENDFELVPYTWPVTGGEIVGNHLVRLIANTNITTPSGNMLVCKDSTESYISVINDLLQFPNTVTANGDGINDIFEIKNLLDGRGYTDNELYIYNSWGRMVYHVQNISKREDFWDPYSDASPSGVYYYRFSAKGYMGNIQRNGIVQVIR